MTKTMPSAGFRALTQEEIQLVSGGYMTQDQGDTTVVTGSRYGYDFWSGYSTADNYYYNDTNDYYGNDGTNDGGGGEQSDPGNGMTSDEAEAALNLMNGARAALQDALLRWGPGTQLDLDGYVIAIDDALIAVDRIIFLLEAGTLVAGIASGDRDVVNVISFVAGIAVVGALAEVEAPFLLAAGLGYAATQVTEGAIRSLTRVVDGVEQRIDMYIQEVVRNNPVAGGYDYNPYDFYRGLMGIPNPYRNFDDIIPQ